MRSTLPELLDSVTDQPSPATADEVAEIRGALDRQLAGAPMPANVTKQRVREALACGGLIAAGGMSSDLGADLLLGQAVNTVLAYDMAVARRDNPDLVDVALTDVLAGESERAWWEQHGGHHEVLRADLEARAEVIGQLIPAPLDEWYPRLEDAFEVAVADGSLTLSGRCDVALGGPPTGRPKVILELKANRLQPGIAEELRHYALGFALRDGVAPAAVIAMSALTGELILQVGDPGALRSAVDRLEVALRRWRAGLAGDESVVSPGWACPMCPVDDCPQRPEEVE